MRAIYVLIGCSTATISPFVPVILKERGLEPATIGVVLAIAALLGTAVVPAWGHVADVILGRARRLPRRASDRRPARPRPCYSIFRSSRRGPCRTAFTVFANLFLALSDTLAVAELPAPERQYGALRAHASLSFALALIGIGVVYDWAGYGVAPAIFLGWSAGAFWLVGRTRDRTKGKTRETRRLPGEPLGRLGSIGRAFDVQPRLWLILTVFAVAFGGMQAALTFIGIRIVELGGHPSDVALSFALSSLTEIPGLVAAGWMGRRLGLRWLFAISLVCMGPASPRGESCRRRSPSTPLAC